MGSQSLDNRPSPGLSINLSSNNPFRNRAASPAFSSPQSADFNTAPPRPTSRNPFLDNNTDLFESESSRNMAAPASNASAPRIALTGNTADLFVRHLPIT
jgi:hypothetical protein